MIEDNLLMLLFVTFATSIVQYSLVRKKVTSIADPLVFFVMMSASSLALSFFASDNSWLVAKIFIYFACFYTGLELASGRPQITIPPLQLGGDMRHFRAIVIVCCVVYLGINSLIWFKYGVILLLDDPSLQKSDVYAGGLGFVRRFNWSVGTFVLIASLYWWFWERSAMSGLALTIAVLVTLSNGSKSALLPVLFAVGLFIAKPFVTPRNRYNTTFIRRSIPLLAIIVCLPIMIVLLAENETAQEAFSAFCVRLFSYGDVLLYWGQESVYRHFVGLGPLSYLQNTFGSVLGALRLTDYNIPIGNQFIRYALPIGVDISESVGPNLPFYVSGELFFGPVFAPLHAFAIGFIFGHLRKLFFSYRGHSLLMYSLLSFVVITSLTLVTDEALAVGMAFDFAIYFVPLYLLVLISFNSVKKDRSTQLKSIMHKCSPETDDAAT